MSQVSETLRNANPSSTSQATSDFSLSRKFHSSSSLDRSRILHMAQSMIVEARCSGQCSPREGVNHFTELQRNQSSSEQFAMADLETMLGPGRMGSVYSPRNDEERKITPGPAKSEEDRRTNDDSESESSECSDKHAYDFPEADPLLFAAAVLGDNSLVTNAETYIEAIREWRTSEEKNFQQQLEDICKSAVTTDEGTELMAVELEGLLSRGNDIVERIKAARADLEKEIHAITLAGKSEEIKAGDFQTQLTAAPEVPSLTDQTEEVIRLELRYTDLARMHVSWECEQKAAEAELEKLESDIGQYCCDIAEALEEVTKTERRSALCRDQKYKTHDRDFGDDSRLSSSSIREGASADADMSQSDHLDDVSTETKRFFNSVLMQCAEVDRLLDSVLQPLDNNPHAEDSGDR